MLRRIGSCAALGILLCAADAVAINAWEGENCGSNPADLSSNPPNWWRYPGCEAWEFQHPCNPAAGYTGYFYKWITPVSEQWDAACCYTGSHGEPFWTYDGNGELVLWGVECIPDL